MKRIVVVCEHRQGALRAVTHELIGAAHELSQGDTEVTAALLCGDASRFTEELRSRVHRLVVVEDQELGDFEAETYREVLRAVLPDQKPDIVLGAHSAFGMDLFPGLAGALGWPLATDVIALEARNSSIVATREMYGGKLQAEVLLGDEGPVMATIRAGAYQPPAVELSAEILEEQVRVLAEPRRRFLGYIRPEAGDVDISQADVVVAIGRGVKDEGNVTAVQEFADMLGGVVAGSRPVIDAGWLPKDRQVGQSGKTVKPKLYLALGISGAFQHVAGMRASDVIVAVNKDPEAPIFEVAHYGIVADMMAVINSLKEELLPE